MACTAALCTRTLPVYRCRRPAQLLTAGKRRERRVCRCAVGSGRSGSLCCRFSWPATRRHGRHGVTGPSCPWPWSPPTGPAHGAVVGRRRPCASTAPRRCSLLFGFYIFERLPCVNWCAHHVVVSAAFSPPRVALYAQRRRRCSAPRRSRRSAAAAASVVWQYAAGRPRKPLEMMTACFGAQLTAPCHPHTPTTDPLTKTPGGGPFSDHFALAAAPSTDKT